MIRPLIIALGILVLTPDLALADPITAIVAGIVGAIGTAGAAIGVAISGLGFIGQALVGLAINFGLSLVIKALTPKKSAAAASALEARGIQSQVQYGGDVSRQAIYGRAATGGQLVFVNTSGSSNGVLDLVFAIGDGQHNALAGMWINGKWATMTSTGTNTWRINDYIDEGLDYMTVQFYPGTLSQVANAGLVARANPSGRWTANHRLAGISYVIVTMQYNQTLFQQGVPTFLFAVEGLKLYDPRLDSTNGGSGSCRFNDQTTWVYTENPAICLYNYQRGLFLNNERVLGMGLPAGDLSTAAYIAAANACDEAVSLAAGGTQLRYRCSVTATEGTQHREVIQSFLDAMGGIMAERAGIYTPFAGVAQTVVVTITDKDLVVGKPVEVSLKKSRSERVNAVFGKFSNPALMYEADSITPITSGTYEAEDGNERLGVELDLRQVFAKEQAQRLAMQQLRLARLMGFASVVLPFAYIRLEVGDWITWNSSGPAGNRTWQILAVRINDDMTISVTMREIASSVYSWSTGDEGTTPAVPLVPLPPSLATALSGFSVSAVDLIGGSTATAFPGIQVDWASISDETITGVLIEYRIGAGGAIESEVSQNVVGGRHYLKNAILPATGYQVRGQPIADPPRAMSWTSWVSVTTTTGLYDDVDRVINTSPPNNPTGLTFATSLVEDATGTVRARLTATVNPNASANWAENLFQISVNGGAYSAAITTATSYTWENLPPNTSVTVQVYARSAAGFLSSSFASGSTTTAAKSAAPGAPSALAATASFRTIALKWTNPTDKDLDYVEIWEATTNNRASATQVAASRTDWAIRTGIGTASTRYYWIRAVNTSGVAGAFHPTSSTAGVAITTTAAITTTEINDDAITTPKLATGAVTADEIAAGAVIAAKIAANAVTADKIDAGAITTDKLGANQVTAEKLAVGSVTAQHIRISPKSIVIDPSFEGGSAAWGAALIQRALYNAGGVPASAPTQYVTQVNGVGELKYQGRIDVTPGEAFRVSAWVRQGTGAIQGGPYISFYSAAGVLLGQITSYPTLTTTWTRTAATGVAPASAAYAEYGIYSPNQSVGTNYWVSDIAIEKMADASLIVDGSITTGKLAANSITATLIAAGAVTSDKITVRTLSADRITLGGVTYDELAAVAATNMWGSTGYGQQLQQYTNVTLAAVNISVPVYTKIGIAAYFDAYSTATSGVPYLQGRIELNYGGMVEAITQFDLNDGRAGVAMLVYGGVAAGSHYVALLGNSGHQGSNVNAQYKSIVVWASIR